MGLAMGITDHDAPTLNVDSGLDLSAPAARLDDPKTEIELSDGAWRGFAPGTWQSGVDVRDFIQRNYTPYEGDGAFLEGATARTTGLWAALQPLLAKERENGILDVSQVPSEILAHEPGFIDKE